MTPPVAATANLAPVPSASSSDASHTSANASSSDFKAPLQQAHQQLQRQSQPARHEHAHARAQSQASTTSDASSSSQTRAHGKSDHKDDDNTQAAVAPGAAAAMLALLGQSVPASAAASSVAGSDADDGGDATAAATTVSAAVASPASATLTLLGAMQGATPAQASDGDDLAKDMDGIKDKSLSLLAQGANDDGDAGDAAATGTQTAKGDAFTSVLQALTSNTAASSNQKDGSDALDALKNLAAAAMPQQTQAQPNPAVTTPHALTMQSSVGTPAFGQELSQQVTWLGGQDVKEARIRLHPEDLGELDVKVSVKQDHVDVAFIAQHPQAVHAVQQTLSQLDSMLAHHGLSLGQAQVGQGNTGQGSSAQSGNSSSGKENGLVEGVAEVASAVSPVAKAVGLVDMFV